MRQQEQGFTLIELVMVIVILGILAAVAIPRYLNLTAESQIAVTNAGVSSSGSAIAISAARHRSTTISPTMTHFLADLPGATCTGAGLVSQGKVNVTMQGAAVAAGVVGATGALTNCTGNTSTVVQSVGQGAYSA